MSAHLTFNAPTLAQLVGASSPRAHVEIGDRSYGSHRIHLGETLDTIDGGSAVVDLGTLPPIVHLAVGGEFGPVGEFTATQIRAALAADGVTWEAT